MSPIFPHSLQCTVLRILPNLFDLPLRGYHPLRRTFPGDFRSVNEDRKAVHTPHLLTISGRIRFALCRFLSLILTTSLLVSFPPGTKTLQFPGFPILSDSTVKSHSEILGSKVACTSPRHIVACHVLHRQSKPSHPPNSLVRT